MSLPSQQYEVTPDGKKIIPASRRPDGSLRKEIRIRDGYLPIEEQQRYVTRGQELRNRRGDLPPGYVPAQPKADPSTRATRRRNNRKKAAGKTDDGEGEIADQLASTTLDDPSVAPSSSDPSASSHAPPPTSEGASLCNEDKRIRVLKKKLREIDNLKARLADEPSAELLPEQKEKLGREEEILSELQELHSGA